MGWASHPSWQIRARQELIERDGRRTIVFSGRRLYRIRTVSVPSGFRFVRGVRRESGDIAVTYDISPYARLGWRYFAFFDGNGRRIECRNCFRLLERGALAACPPSARRVTFWGTNGDDYLTGSSGMDQICGLGGHDVLIGDTAGDLLIGGSGDDELYGEDGFDELRGGLGADRLYGGAHDDRVTGGPASDVHDGGAGNDVVVSRDGRRDWRVKGGPGQDRCVRDRYDPRLGCEL